MLAGTSTAAVLPARAPSPLPSAAAQPAYVHPGRLASGAGGTALTTVVGSGAAVCLWDPTANVAGLAHFLLPEKGNAPSAPRFGDVALAQLLEELKRLGATPLRLRAAVFGGSAPPIGVGVGHLGDRNVSAALDFLAAHGIPVVQKDVGGSGGRKVIFNPAIGRSEVVKLHGA